MAKINTINKQAEISEISDFKYQIDLTKKLDNENKDFTQEIINEIVLWKVNRYAELDDSILQCLNKISKSDNQLNIKLTTEILKELLNPKTKGIRLAMASTILRFKNPHIYQIIDQRVYRYIYGIELKEGTNSEELIKLYLDYLDDLRRVCKEFDINFEESDRILYLMDKKYNKENNLKESRKKPNA